MFGKTHFVLQDGYGLWLLASYILVSFLKEAQAHMCTYVARYDLRSSVYTRDVVFLFSVLFSVVYFLVVRCELGRNTVLCWAIPRLYVLGL